MAWGTSAWGGGGGGTGPWGACIPGGPDLTLPTISLQSPAPTSTVSNNTNIAFRISDDVGVDFNTIVVKVTVGVTTYTAFSDGVFDPLFNGVQNFLSANATNGFDFIIQPSIVWAAGSTVSVTVVAGDTSCNLVTTSWSFQIEETESVCCGPINFIDVPYLGGWGDHEWGTSYWGGGLTVSLPVDGGGVPLIGSITPNQGFTTGGDNFTIIGSNLASFFFNDRFSDAIVGFLWYQMGGLITEGPIGFNGSLHCKTVGFNSYSGVVANYLKPNGDFHVALDFLVKTPFLTKKPPVEVVLAAVEAFVDDGNRIRFSYVAKGSTSILRMEVWKTGILRHIKEKQLSTFSGNLGIMRYYDSIHSDEKVAFWFNGNKIFDCFDGPVGTLQIRFFTYNNNSSYELETWFDNFISHTVIVFTGPFGSDVVTNVVEVNTNRVRGKTPATVENWAGDVNIRVTNGSGSGCVGTCYASVTPYVPASPSDWESPAPTTVEEAMLRIQLELLDHFDGTVSTLGVCSNLVDLAADLALHIDFAVSPTLDDISHKLFLHTEHPIGHPDVLSSGGCFQYEYPPGYIVGRSQPFRPTLREVSICNDEALRNPGPNIGLGLRVEY